MTSCSTGVNESTTSSRSILRYSIFKIRILDFFSFIHKFLPSKHSFVFDSNIFDQPTNNCFYLRHLFNNAHICIQLLSWVNKYNFSFWMLCLVNSDLFSVCLIYSRWNTICKNRTKKSNCPLWAVESTNVDRLSLGNTYSNQTFGKLSYLIIVINPCPNKLSSISYNS